MYHNSTVLGQTWSKRISKQLGATLSKPAITPETTEQCNMLFVESVHN